MSVFRFSIAFARRLNDAIALAHYNAMTSSARPAQVSDIELFVQACGAPLIHARIGPRFHARGRPSTTAQYSRLIFARAR
jgi:hypothetical protein